MSAIRGNESDNDNDNIDEDDEIRDEHMHDVVDMKGDDDEEQDEDYDYDDYIEYENIFWEIISSMLWAYSLPQDFIEIVERYPHLVQQLDLDGNYPLHIACRSCGNDSVIMKLIDLFPMAVEKMNNEGCYPLHCAIYNAADYPIVEKLIEIFPKAANVRVSYDDNKREYGFALHMACHMNQREHVVYKLIKINPLALQVTDSDGKYEEDYYPIHNAIQNNSFDSYFSLIRYMMRVDPLAVQRQTGDGDSPLHMACEDDDFHPLVESMLKQSNVKVNMRNNRGKTTLHLACQYGAEKIVEKLLQHPDIDVNAKDNSDKTPLYKASIHMNIDTVQQLLDHPFILINEKNRYTNQTTLDSIKQKIKTLLEEVQVPGNIDHISYCEGIVKLLEEFPVKRRWQSYTYFWELVIPQNV